jgi:phosphoesterase family protein
MTVSYALSPIRMIAVCALISIELSSFAPRAFSQPRPDAQSGRYFDHVVIVVLENQGTREALADANIASLVKSGAWFSDYHGLAHPSLPNYLAIVAGSTFGVERDHLSAPLKAPTIVDRLEAKGLTWKAYAEDYPGKCFLGNEAGVGRLTPRAKPIALYAKKHVPLLEFESVQKNPARCARVVNAREFMRDARSGHLPNYSFYSPNVFNDGHDTSLETASAWLKGFVQSFRGTLGMHQRTLLVVTWDEGGEEDSRHNQVLTIFLGDVVNPGRYDAKLTHYSLLRTIENNFGLEQLTKGDRTAAAMPARVWRD